MAKYPQGVSSFIPQYQPYQVDFNYVNNVLATKQDQYDMFFYIMPKLKYKKIDYIKKVKKEDKEEEVYIPEFLSKREYKQYVEFKNSISK